MEHYWIIIRPTHSGGQAVVSLGPDGPFYTSTGQRNAMKLYDEESAIAFRDYASKHINEFPGQVGKLEAKHVVINH